MKLLVHSATRTRCRTLTDSGKRSERSGQIVGHSYKVSRDGRSQRSLPSSASLAPEMVTSSQNAVSGPLYATRCEAGAPRELTIRALRFVRQSGPMDSALKAARYKVTALLIALYSIT